MFDVYCKAISNLVVCIERKRGKVGTVCNRVFKKCMFYKNSHRISLK
jgi:uncharacterized protein (DUF2141 family)